jgi:putative membrane protein
VLTSLATATIAAHAGPWGAGPGWFFLLIPLFWIALIAILVAVFGRRMRRARAEGGYGAWGGGAPWSHYAAQTAARGAESTLAERFAQGDIDEKEYRARLEVLRANDRGAGPASA